MPLSRRRFVTTTVAAAAAHAADFRSEWASELTRPWLGRDYWANPMQDWRIGNGRMECHVAGGDRNVFLLTREIASQPGGFTMSVRLGRLDDQPLERGFVGFRTGIRGQFHDYRDSAVHGEGVNMGILADGRLFIHTPEAGAPKVSLQADELLLRLTASSGNLLLEVLDKSGAKLAELSRSNTAADWMEGGVAIVCSSAEVQSAPRRAAQRGGTMRFWFRNWTLSGSKVAGHPERAFGPIFFAMHTLSRRVLKVTAQLAPLEPGDHEALLQTRSGNVWRTVATSGIDPMARTATFRVTAWDDTRDTPYRILLAPGGETGPSFEGVIRKDPKDKARITIGALTCTNDFGFPHQDIARNLRHFRPDILFFTGDQIYEGVGGYGIQMEPPDAAALDYLRKWLLFGWSFCDLMRDIPAITIPDDHDVYHGNVWGAAGKKAVVDPNDPEAALNRNKAWQDSGGYKMPAEWVNMVQRTQTSHLPDPFDPTPVGQGITVYYTSLLYGGASFAILEDRKWKSSPRVAIPWADIQNGWAQNPDYNGAEHGDVAGAELLGPRQLAFLEKWAQDWNGAWIKAVVSQTLWANLATLPPPANNDDVTGKLAILKPGEHSKGEVRVQDHDSNGWPQTPRTLGLRAMRKALAFHIGGDQHLGSTIQYGIDTWNDGPWMICTPAVSNIFPRRWYPPEEGRNRPPERPRYCGEFLDGFGNKVTVHAVANPQQFGARPAALHNRAPGYGMIELDRATRKITLANWPRWVDASQSGARPYPGWPITIHQYDNGLATAPFELGEISAPAADMVAQVTDEASGETVYTVRIQGRRFTPRVFREGRYTVRLLDVRGKAREWRGRLARRRA
ncbi:MAG: alkaline phosphatase D family protein [Acidobacteria bacterium]|nr:alkaline phosphatase D family protein [Acidobacteriota bacterium]